MKTALFVLGYASRNAAEEGVAISDADLAALTALSEAAGVDADVKLACEARVTWGRKPGIRLIRAERDRLLSDINTSEADFVVAFGPVAVAALWNKAQKARSLREKPHTLEGINKTVWVTFSLEELAMKPGLRHAMTSDLLRAVRGYSQVIWGDYHIGTEIHVDLQEYLETAEKPVVTVDLETYPGLDPFAPDARIRMAVVSHRSGWAQVVQAGPTSELPEWILHLLRDSRVLKVGSNIRFDVRWLRRFGYEVNNAWCTQHGEHLIDENGGLHDLKSLVLQYHPTLGDYAEGQRAMVEAHGGDWAPISDADMYQYAGGDGDGGITVFQKQAERIEARGLTRPYNVMREWFPTITEFEVAGACVDMRENEALRERYNDELARLRAEIRGVLGPINPNSPTQLVKALQGVVPDIDLKSFFAKKKDLDKYSTRAAVLRREARKHPVIGTVLQYRRRNALFNFVESVKKYAVYHHGQWFIHSQLRGDIAATFRHTSSHPNLQNLPKSNAEEDAGQLNVKRQYISRFEGGMIAEFDESQLELREAGMISGDKALFEAFASGVDVHTYLAALMLGLPQDQVSKEQRASCKSTNFHVLYGGGPTGLAQRLGVAFATGQELIEIFDETFTGFRKWESGVRRQARHELVVYSRYGTPRRFIRPPSWKSPAGRRILRQAGNAPIQGGASWHTNLGLTKAMHLMRSRGLRSVLFLTVHDSGVVDVYPGEWEAVRECMVEGMERPDTQKYGVELTIPLVVDSKLGPNWGDMHES
jgi:DNA polymerase I